MRACLVCAVRVRKEIEKGDPMGNLVNFLMDGRLAFCFLLNSRHRKAQAALAI